MKILRIILVLAVLAYAGWLAWPILSPFIVGPTDTAGPSARAAIEGADLSGAWLWIVAAVLYVVAALMLGAGNPRAAIAYFIEETPIAETRKLFHQLLPSWDAFKRRRLPGLKKQLPPKE